MSPALTAAVAIVRRQMDRAYGLAWCARFGAALGCGWAVAPHVRRPEALALAALVAGPLGARDRRERADPRRVLFFTIPLYGRQLARALAIAPVLAALAVPLGITAGLGLRGRPLARTAAAALALATADAALVDLSGAFREGDDARLYVALGAAAGLAVLAPLAAPRRPRLALVVAAALATGFAALRAFGETLARYDPLP